MAVMRSSNGGINLEAIERMHFPELVGWLREAQQFGVKR